MENAPESSDLELIVVIVNYGTGSKVLKIAKNNGISDGVVFLGMGTMKNRILEFLELTDIRKEVVVLPARKTVAQNTLKNIDQELELRKPYHGIAFTIPLSMIIGIHGNVHGYNSCGGNCMYKLITVIVDKGKAELVMESATGAGARGGTVVKARGTTGLGETVKLFNMDIEPEKEMVIILSASSKTEKIASAIGQRLDIEKRGNGIIYCQDVSSTFGVS